MDVTDLRAALPPAGPAVLADRLRLDPAPPRWLAPAVRWARLLAVGVFAFRFAVAAFDPFRPPLSLTALVWAAAVGVGGGWAVNWWVRRYDRAVFHWAAAWVWPNPPLTARFRDWSDVADRLAASAYMFTARGAIVRERDHLFLGTVHGTRWPFLHDVSRPRHVLTTGATSSGKTHRVFLPAATQLIRRRSASVIVIDLKGDKALFYSLAAEARRARIDFKWVNPDVGSSYVFNPLSQRFFDRLAEDAQVQFVGQALGLDGQGRQDDVFFSDLNERVLRRFYRAARPRSFRQLVEAIERPGGAGAAEVTAREWELAMHLRAALDRVAHVLPLNATDVGPGVTREMLAGAVDLDDLLARPQVLYVWLPASLQRATGRAVGRVVNQGVVAAARTYAGDRVPVHVFQDEFQELVGTAAVDGILRQARDFGVSFWLACQQLSALRQGQHDCLDAVTGNVSLQVHFSATDQTGHDHLVRISGETSRWLRGETDTPDGVRNQMREVVRPRLTDEDVARLNAAPGDLAAAVVAPLTPLAPFRHLFLLRTAYAISARHFQRLRDLPFPLPTRFTVFNPPAVPRANAPAAEGARPEPAAPQPAAPPAQPQIVNPPAPQTPASAPGRPTAPAPSPHAAGGASPAAAPVFRPPAPAREGPSREAVRSEAPPTPAPPAGLGRGAGRRSRKPAPAAGGAAPRAAMPAPEPSGDLAEYLKRLRLEDAAGVTRPPVPPAGG